MIASNANFDPVQNGGQQSPLIGIGCEYQSPFTLEGIRSMHGPGNSFKESRGAGNQSDTVKVTGNMKTGNVKSVNRFFKDLLHLRGATNIRPRTELNPVTKNGENFVQNVIILDVDLDRRHRCQCPKCLAEGKSRRQAPGKFRDYKYEKPGTWRADNLNGVPVYLSYRPQRITCPNGHGVITEQIPRADEGSRFTPDFNDEITFMALASNKTATCEYFQVNWATVGNCIRATHNRLEPDPSQRTKNLRRIVVDETSYADGHKYITVVTDIDRNVAVRAHEGHSEATFSLFCESLTPAQRRMMTLVAGDGARWIDACVNKYFPNAQRCVDPFHVVSWINEALDQVRKDMVNKAQREFYARRIEFSKVEEELIKELESIDAEPAGMPRRGRPGKRRLELLQMKEEPEAMQLGSVKLSSTDKSRGINRKSKGAVAFTPGHQAELERLRKIYDEMKGARYACGKNPEHLTSNQQSRLDLIITEYPEIDTAYRLREQCRIIIHMKDADLAAVELDKWIDTAAECGLKPMEDLSARILRHRENILRSIREQASSSKAEAFNSTVRSLIHSARGFRNLDNMIGLICLKCGDIVIPLNNRPCDSVEKLAGMRNRANMRRHLREEQMRAGNTAA